MTAPIVISLLSDIETPISLFHKLAEEEPTAFLLESTEGHSRLARYSFLGISPSKTVTFEGNEAILEEPRTGRREVFSIRNPLTFLKETMEAEQHNYRPHPDFPFSGGWVGYLGYGATQFFEGIPQQESDPFEVPTGFYGLYDSVIVFDHLHRRISFVSHRPEQEAVALWRDLYNRIREGGLLPPLSCLPGRMSEAEIFDGATGPFDKAAYCDAVRQCKAWIQEGQVFQIVLAHRFSVPFGGLPMNAYRMVQAVNPSPYAYYLKCPGFTYLGSSPETFLRCQNGDVSLRVLAGTRPRGLTDAADQRLAEELRSNEKEMAEHRMLVDLGRNDLGRICRAGTVQYGQIATLTRYTHVMHLATELTGTLQESKSAFDAFQSCFPRGTVSGAPKIRAMQLLATLEPEQRGIYSGAVGYFDFSGNTDSAIAIRSVLIKDGMAHVNAGAGVVYDSVPEDEYQETRNKASSILQAVRLADRVASVGRMEGVSIR